MTNPQTRHQPAPSPRRSKLAEIARQVREDARSKPERYLKDSEVPHGGE